MLTIDLDCHGDVSWTLHTRSRLDQLRSQRLKARLEWSRDSDIGKLELTAASKLAMLLLVKNRVNLELKELIQELNERLTPLHCALSTPRSCHFAIYRRFGGSWSMWIPLSFNRGRLTRSLVNS
jgi:hypothetical protein